MEIGIVGLQGVGKSMVFQALTEGAASTTRSGGGGMAPNIGIARVPDPRLGIIARFNKTKEVVPATIQLVDIPGFPTGPETAPGGSFAKQVLAHIREVDALCHVVRCFRGLDGSSPNPASDIVAMETEMVFADLAVAEPALDKAVRGARGLADKDAKARLSSLEKILPVLSEGKPIRTMMETLSPEEQAAVRGFGMITAKPVFYVSNVEEGDVGGKGAAEKEVERIVKEMGAEAVEVCAKLEAELVELNPEDRQEMLASLGLKEPALAVVARALYRLLGWTSFYTAGDKAIRAWPIRAGATAPEAAGVIHTDIQRGFIRAECYHVNDLESLGSEKAIKEAGKLRSEGKGYVLQEGDVVYFLFNV